VLIRPSPTSGAISLPILLLASTLGQSLDLLLADSFVTKAGHWLK
jgi:hypothetical protein